MLSKFLLALGLTTFTCSIEAQNPKPQQLTSEQQAAKFKEHWGKPLEEAQREFQNNNDRESAAFVAEILDSLDKPNGMAPAALERNFERIKKQVRELVRAGALESAATLNAALSDIGDPTPPKSGPANPNHKTGAVPRPDGLVLYFPFDKPDAEGVVVDESGAGNDGHVFGAKWVAEGKFGGAYEFHITNLTDRIVVPNSETLNPDNITIAAWIKAADRDGFWNRIVDKDYRNGYCLGLGGDFKGKAPRGQLAFEPSAGSIGTMRTLSDNQWHHVAATYDGKTLKIYIDGTGPPERAARNPGPLGKNSWDLCIGNNVVDYGTGEFNAFDGLIDEVRIYNRALSVEEIKALAGATNAAADILTHTNAAGKLAIKTQESDNESARQAYELKVQVEETRIDAVVLDKSGRQIRDLKADEFELYQDGNRQEIKSCVYVNEDQGSPDRTLSRKSSNGSPWVSTPLIPRENVQRTIAFVIDDIPMSLEEFSNARGAIQKFIESQMQSGDLIAIARTSHGVGASQLFSTDKMRLMSTIKSMHCGSGCLAHTRSTAKEMMADNYNPIVDASLTEKDLEMFRHQPMRTCKPSQDENPWPQIATLRYYIHALQDMPERKSLLFISRNVTYAPDKKRLANIEQVFNRLSDEALRAGVVIYAMDARGLIGGTRNPCGVKYVPWPEKTGGVIVENNNFFLHGIGPIEEELKGYYLLSYVSPAGTFDNNQGDLYHQIRIKVKRPGSIIHNRTGFVGVVDRPSSPPGFRVNTLRQAMYSPFAYNDLKLALSSGYAHAAISGYFLASRLHLDGMNLVFNKEISGNHYLSLEIETLTSNGNNVIEDSKNVKYGFEIKGEELPNIKKYGIDLSMYLPVKKPDAYYVRAAIKDRNSGKIGSAYQFLEIPDLQKKRIDAFKHICFQA